jgi:hypothetical protein
MGGGLLWVENGSAAHPRERRQSSTLRQPQKTLREKHDPRLFSPKPLLYESHSRVAHMATGELFAGPDSAYNPGHEYDLPWIARIRDWCGFVAVNFERKSEDSYDNSTHQHQSQQQDSSHREPRYSCHREAGPEITGAQLSLCVPSQKTPGTAKTTSVARKESPSR